ncbi:hypothetical protein SEA_RAHALELUJAH_69 [Mycobacterium phage Rahalelujah]|nr:hypothetical protein SEA_RAHALELUJAH_69 [Mycobacterium phage Rahalelujah]
MQFGIGTILFVVFLVLKLGVGDTGVVDWSWWWVTAPLWGPVAFVAALYAIAGGITYAADKAGK